MVREGGLWSGSVYRWLSCDLQYAVDLAEMALLESISSSRVVIVLAMFVFTVVVRRVLIFELEKC